MEINDTLFVGSWNYISQIYPIHTISNNPDSLIIKNYSIKPLSQLFITSITKVNDHFFILGIPQYFEGLFLFDNYQKKVIRFDSKNSINTSSDNKIPPTFHIKKVIPSTNGIFYGLSHGEGLIVLKEEAGQLTIQGCKSLVSGYNDDIRKNDLNDGYQATDSTLNLFSDIGIGIYNILTGKSFFPSDFYSDNKILISCITPSQKTNMWIGSFSLGLFHYSKSRNQFTTPASLSKLKAINIAITPGMDIWVQTFDRTLNIYNKDFDQIRSEKNNIFLFQSSSEPIFYHNNTGYYINDRDKIIKFMPALPLESIVGLTQDKIVYRYRAANINLVYENLSDKTHKTITRYHATACIDEKCQKIFYTHNRIWRIDLKDLSSDSTGIINPLITGINYDDGNLICWNAQSIFIYDSLLNKKNAVPIPENMTIAKAVKHNNTLYIASDIGLMAYNLENNSYCLLTRNEGLPANNISDLKYDEKRKILLAGTWNGIAVINPEKINLQSTLDLKVYLASLKVFNETIHPSEKGIIKTNIILSEEITLNYSQKIFSLEFFVNDYSIQKGVSYAYNLEGYDTNWIYTKAVNMATFSNIPHGHYNFIVKARYNNIWGQPTSIHINILPPFWQTWWFRILVLLIIIGTAIGTHFYRLHNLIRQKKQLDLEVKEKTKELVNKNAEIEAQSENLKEINVLLEEKQEEIRIQSEDLYKHNVELKKVISTKDKLFSIIAHDLRNPFHSIMGFSKLILDEKKLEIDSDTNKFIEAIYSSSTSASSLLENLLTWSRAQSLQVRVNPVSFNLSQVVKDTFSLLKGSADNKNIRLVSEIDGDTTILADKEMIQTVIRNLTNNAIKFTDKGGLIKIYSKHKDSSLIINIEDNGVGISNDKIATLFKVDQIESTKGTGGESGTGLGLTICKEFIDKNNGTIEVSSKMGKGTIFSIVLPDDPDKKIEPVAKPKEITAEKQKIITAPESGVQKDKSEKILIVDDNTSIILSIKTALEKEYEIFTADNGETAWDIAFQIVPDLIISDVMMPVMNGYEFCNKIKTAGITAHIPVILLTAKDQTADKISGYKEGADEYFIKPVETALLLERIKNLISTRKNLREQFIRSYILSTTSEKTGKHEDSFVLKAIGIVEKYLTDEKLDIYILAKELAVSISQLNKKLKATTNQTPTEFIRTIRLKKAANLLSINNMRVNEVYPLVGFSDRSYFSKTFTELFGVSPSDFKNIKGA